MNYPIKAMHEQQHAQRNPMQKSGKTCNKMIEHATLSRFFLNAIEVPMGNPMLPDPWGPATFKGTEGARGSDQVGELIRSAGFTVVHNRLGDFGDALAVVLAINYSCYFDLSMD